MQRLSSFLQFQRWDRVLSRPKVVWISFKYLRVKGLVPTDMLAANQKKSLEILEEPFRLLFSRSACRKAAEIAKTYAGILANHGWLIAHDKSLRGSILPQQIRNLGVKVEGHENRIIDCAGFESFGQV